MPIERPGTAATLDVSGTGRDALAEASFDDSLIDTSGTGGDASGTFNISTATALVTAGAGVRVAKHGNRSISSKCGSADVVEALGVNIQLSPDQAARCLREVGICFLYAPNLHPAMKQVQGVRRELRMRTMFNLLGPLTNPARASGQVVGVYSLDLVEKLAEALSMLGLRRALVVHGLDGLDEITITGKTRVAEAREGSVRSYEIEPEEFGLKRATLDQEFPAAMPGEMPPSFARCLGGEKSPGEILLFSMQLRRWSLRAGRITSERRFRWPRTPSTPAQLPENWKA